MGDLTALMRHIEGGALTPREISHRSGVSLPRVKKIAAFLEEFGLVKIKGTMVIASDELLALPVS